MSHAEPVAVQRFSEQQIAALNARLGGYTVHPQHRGYQHARRIWNYMIDRHPAVVLRYETDADVFAAIAFAREHSVPLTVKAGGQVSRGIPWSKTASSSILVGCAESPSLPTPGAYGTAAAACSLTSTERRRSTASQRRRA